MQGVEGEIEAEISQCGTPKSEVLKISWIHFSRWRKPGTEQAEVDWGEEKQGVGWRQGDEGRTALEAVSLDQGIPAWFKACFEVLQSMLKQNWL